MISIPRLLNLLIANLFNKFSLIQIVFPKHLKIAKVIPRYKSGDCEIIKIIGLYQCYLCFQQFLSV